MLSLYLSMLDSEEEHTFEELYLAHKDTMFNVAYRILKDKVRAEDAVHDAFLSFAKNFYKTYEMSCNQIRVYLITIVRNRALRMYNLQKREVLLEEVSHESPCDVELDVENREMQATIMRLINALDPKYRDVLVMRFYLDMKEKEIAEALEISVQNVKVRLHRGKNMVKKRLLEEKHYDGETV